MDTAPPQGDLSRSLDHWHASDLEYLRRLEYVRALLEGLETLRVDEHDLHTGDGTSPSFSRITTTQAQQQQLPSALSLLSLAPFASLARLELRGCDLSAATRRPIWDGNLVRGLREVRTHLVEMDLRRCVGTLAMLFVGEGETSNTDDVDTRGSRFDDTFDPKPRAATWPMLRSLTCVGGDLTEVDASVRLCPRLRRLDLRRNGVERIDPDGTRCLSELTHLDLGFNRVRDARWLPDALHADGRVLTSLSLRGNKLRSARGLETLKSLESLDVAGNLLRSMKHDVAFIADNLPRLRKVWLEGNPVSAVAGYRTQALACWPDTRAVELDGRPASKFDKFTLRHYRKATQLKARMRRTGGMRNPGGSETGSSDDETKSNGSDEEHFTSDPATPATPPLPASTPPPSFLAARASSRRRRKMNRRDANANASFTAHDVSEEDAEAMRAAVLSGFDTFWHGFEPEPRGVAPVPEDEPSPSPSPGEFTTPDDATRTPRAVTRGDATPIGIRPLPRGDESSPGESYLSTSAPSDLRGKRRPPKPPGGGPGSSSSSRSRSGRIDGGGRGTPGHGRHLSLELNKPPPRFTGISRVMDLTSFESDAEAQMFFTDDESGENTSGLATPESLPSGARSPARIAPTLRSRRRAARTSEGIESDTTTDDSEDDTNGLYSPLKLSKTALRVQPDDELLEERRGGIPSARGLFTSTRDSVLEEESVLVGSDAAVNASAGSPSGGESTGESPGRGLVRTFRARVARNALAETFIGAFSCSRMRPPHGDLRVGLGVPPDSAEPGEEEVTVMVSDVRVYVCRPDAGAAALWSCALSHLGSVSVGAGEQILCLVPRASLAPAVLVTRCSETARSILSALTSNAAATDVKVSDAAALTQLDLARRMLRSSCVRVESSPVARFRAGSPVRGLRTSSPENDASDEDDSSLEVRAYAMVWIRKNGGKNMEPRTLVLTDGHVALAEEDAGGFRERFVPDETTAESPGGNYLTCEKKLPSGSIAGVDVGWSDADAAAAAMGSAQGRTPACAPMACVTMTFRRKEGDGTPGRKGRRLRVGSGKAEPARGEAPWEMMLAASEAVRLQTLVGSWDGAGMR